jgi:DNA-binding response OmpR family regulator
MRSLSSARIVVLDANSEHRNFLCAALAAFGMQRVFPASSLEEARHTAAGEIAPDLCVVDSRQLSAMAASGPRIPRNPFDPARTPGILLAVDTTREMIKAASANGYNVVLGVPVVPRLLYRRIGSILQKVRRAERRNGLNLVAEAAALAELQEG